MLHDLMAKYGSDKAAHGFCPFYEDFFAPVRMDVKSVLEIGVEDGASIRGWLDYFPNATVWGLDAPFDAVGKYGDMTNWPNNGRCVFVQGDQANLHPPMGTGAEPGDREVGIGVPGQQCELEEHHRGVPHRR